MINVTDKAIGEVKRIISEQGLAENTFLKVGVSAGGCSGFSYLLEFSNELDEGDQELEIGDFKVVVAAGAEPYLENITVDFRDDVMKRGFVFDNPNASGTCGCGSSFSV